jgi:hypothetical protein
MGEVIHETKELTAVKTCGRKALELNKYRYKAYNIYIISARKPTVKHNLEADIQHLSLQARRLERTKLSTSACSAVCFCTKSSEIEGFSDIIKQFQIEIIRLY